MDQMNDAGLSAYKIPEDLIMHIPQYLSRREGDLIELKSALREGKFDVIYKIGHNMKGNGSSYGFDRLSSIGENLVSACKTQDLFKSNDHLLTPLGEEVIQANQNRVMPQCTSG